MGKYESTFQAGVTLLLAEGKSAPGLWLAVSSEVYDSVLLHLDADSYKRKYTACLMPIAYFLRFEDRLVRCHQSDE